MSDETRLEKVNTVLEKQKTWSRGTYVINCVRHSGPLELRPRDCDLCATDIRNQLMYALKVNSFLNDLLEEISAVVAAP